MRYFLPWVAKVFVVSAAPMADNIGLFVFGEIFSLILFALGANNIATQRFWLILADLDADDVLYTLDLPINFVVKAALSM